ncbi:MAG TPA: hypothetical protein VGS10_15130 [Terracidiphilus sp.]|nr:hypothetical protein [Terracidiphilus sp.]
MKTEYVVGNFRIHFESRSRRRLFVALCYAAFAASDLLWCFLNPKMNPAAGPEGAIGAWIIAGCMFFSLALVVVLTGLSGDLRARGDERETHRREHSISRGYPYVGFGIMAALFAGSFGVTNPATSPMPQALRDFLVQLTFILLMATLFLYVTLPQAILLWTEPDLDPGQEQIN